MSTFGNALSRLIDNGERQALSLLSEAQRAIDNFDFDATFDSIMKSGRNAFDGFNDFIKTVKDSVSDFKIIIPFDEKNEKFNVKIEDDNITVTVDGKNSHRKTEATIPANCITDKLTHFVDKKKGNLVVVIPKDVTEDENFKKIKDNVTTKVNSTATWLKDALKERAESVAASTTAPTSKPKYRKKRQTKVVRGKDGRFVSAKKARE